MPSTTMAIVVAVIAAVASLAGSLAVEISRRRSAAQIQEKTAKQQEDLEELKHRLGIERDAVSRSEQAAAVMTTYRNPLARSSYDLQSRIYNIYRGFQGRRDPEYFRTNTQFVIAEFLGWLEIVRQEIQFLDTDGDAREVQRCIDTVRDALAESSERVGMGDGLYLYRGHQRAIGEMMIVDSPTATGPAQQCRGYASFMTRLDDPEFARWFDRLGDEIDNLRSRRPARLVRVQHALIDLLDVLDPDRSRFPGDRDRVDAAWATD